MQIITILFLGIEAWIDWKRREIDLLLLLLYSGMITFFAVWQKVELSFEGLLPGVCLYLLSLWKKEDIGSGDGFLVAALGWGIGLERVMRVSVLSFFMAAIGGVICLIKGGHKKDAMPFAPCLCGGFLLHEVLGALWNW